MRGVVNPTLGVDGGVRALFSFSWDSLRVEMYALDRICQICYSDVNAIRFREKSLDYICIKTHSDAVIATADAMSLDGDSGLLSYSIDVSGDDN